MKAILAATFAAIHFAKAQSPVYGQCGGMGWSGPTTCAAGSTCIESNPYYSQCLPGATPKPPSSGSGSGLPFLGGVNTAGYDFSVVTDGSFNGTGVSPPPSQFAHFAREGANLFRIPFAWQLMTPTLGGNINASFFAEYDATVQAALATGAYVIVDLHNYARWNGAVIGQGGPTDAQYASIWMQLATKYASTRKIIFGIMNEPHDLPQGTYFWAVSVQAAVNAIRAAGATSQIILIPGSSYSSAQALPTEAGPDLLKVTDPVGNSSLLVFDVHKYLDSDNSGTHADCVTDNVAILTNLVSWLQSNGNRQALLSETGGGSTASCETDLRSELAFVKSNSNNIVGFAVWAAGAFLPSYILSVTPNPDGSDQPIWVQAVQANLP